MNSMRQSRPGGRVAMRDVARAEHVIAGARIDRLIADVEGGAALEDPERLVLAVMHVQRPGEVRRIGGTSAFVEGVLIRYSITSE